jgi:Glutathione S-transferase
MLTLFHAKSTCSLASLITLKEAEIAHEVHIVDLAGKEQTTPAFLAVNPKGRVPALKTEAGVLTETPAILLYLAQIAPEKGLAPLGDPFALAELQSFNSYLCSTVHPVHAHRVRGSRWADEESSLADMKRRVPGNMAACYGLIEANFFRGPFVMGERLTIADPYLFTIDTWLKSDGVDIADFPRLHEHYRRMLDRPAVQAAIAVAGG